MTRTIGNGAATRDVAIQDQTTQTVILPMAQELADAVLAADTVLNSYTMIVDDATGFVVGQHIRIINSGADRYFFGAILGIASTTITVDTPIDFEYLTGSEVTVSNLNLAVNGSGTPVIFVLRTGSPSIPSKIDITRVIITCETEGAVDLNKFGDLPALTRGMVLRRLNGDQLNVFNVKSNREMTAIAYDWTPFVASNPAQGIDGFSLRLTFGGQSKIGVVLRVEQLGNLEMLIQDDLTGLVSLNVMLEGHVVED